MAVGAVDLFLARTDANRQQLPEDKIVRVLPLRVAGTGTEPCILSDYLPTSSLCFKLLQNYHII
jgi:hypothetical protein